MQKQWLVAALAGAALTLASSVDATATGPAGPAAGPTIGNVQRMCALPNRTHQMSCLALRRVDHPRPPVRTRHLAAASPPPVGLGPADLQSAYNLPSDTAGTGMTVAIVDAFDDPSAEADLGVYRSTTGLPACTTANGCFQLVNQSGSPSPRPTPDQGWGSEISLDLDMVSAVCPNCHILLVETNSNNDTDLFSGVNTAVALGARFVSNSYGGSESSGQTAFDSQFFNHPGVAITVATGDGGFGVAYPATSQFVTSVGGTSLTADFSSRGWSETAWSGAGSGCSAFDPKPAWEDASTACANRAIADVSAVADPSTGVGMYDSFGLGGWNVFGGTSAAAPIVAGVYALAGTPGASDYPATYPWHHASSLFDVTSGSNGTCSPAVWCTAAAGWDGPTGLGTPNGTTAFVHPVSNDFSIGASPGSQTVIAGSSVTYSVATSVTSGSATTVSLAATGLPAGATASFSLNPVTSGGSSTLTVTTSSGTPNSTSRITISGTSSEITHSGSALLTVIGGAGVTNGGFETGDFTGWTTSGAVTQVVTSPVHSGSFAAQLGGIDATNGDSTLTQTIAVPATATALTFWYNPNCLDTIQFDQEQAAILDTSGHVLATVINVCENTNAWTQVVFDVTPFRGQTVVLRFNNHDDGFPADPTFTVFDDISVS